MLSNGPRRWAFYHWSLLIHPLMPWVFTGVDDFCNPTLHIVIPCVGCLMFCYRLGPLRTEPCAECQQLTHWIDKEHV